LKFQKTRFWNYGRVLDQEYLAVYSDIDHHLVSDPNCRNADALKALQIFCQSRQRLIQIYRHILNRPLWDFQKLHEMLIFIQDLHSMFPLFHQVFPLLHRCVVLESRFLLHLLNALMAMHRYEFKDSILELHAASLSFREWTKIQSLDSFEILSYLTYLMDMIMSKQAFIFDLATAPHISFHQRYFLLISD
jgi:hypothetical protein